MSFNRVRIYIYIILVVMLLVSCVGAADDKVVKQSVLKVVEDKDKLTAPVTVVNISKGYVTTEPHTESKSLVTNIVKKIGLAKPVSETTSLLKGIDKHRITAEYIENNVDLIGKHTIVSDKKTINITIYSQVYEPITGMNKFNLTATVNGKSVLIHNPFRVYGIPITIKQLRNETTYLNANSNFREFVAPTFINNTYASGVISNLITRPIIKQVEVEVEAPKDAVLQNLVYALSFMKYGEPTFDDPDPTTAFYATGNWTSPANAYLASATVVGGGGGATEGYIGAYIYYTGGLLTNAIVNTAGAGSGGFASITKSVVDFPITGGNTYTVEVGGYGSGNAGGAFQTFYCFINDGGSPTSCTPASGVITAANGSNSSIFSNTSVGGIGGGLSGSATTISRTNTIYGSDGYSGGTPTYSATSGTAAAGSGGAAGSGVGAGGGGGGAGSSSYIITHYYPATYISYAPEYVTGSGGRGATGIVVIDYTVHPATASWGSSIYSLNENAAYTYSIDSSYWDTTGTYSYYIVTTKAATPDITIATKQITDQNGTAYILFDSSTYNTGTHNGYVKMVNANTGGIVTLGYASTEISSIVRTNGYTLNAVTGASISGSNVSISQNTVFINNITTTTGYYDTTPAAFQTGTPITYNVTQSGYYPYTKTFTPISTVPIVLNISLIPTTAISGNIIGGIIGEYPYGVPVSGASATVSNITNTLTNTSNAQGFYFVGGVASGTTYNVSSTKSGYYPSVVTPIVAGSGFTEQDTQMNATYTFTAQFIDSATSEVISKVNVEDNLGFSTTTSTGTFSNTYQYGSVTFKCTASLYTEKSITYVIDSSKSVNITLTKGGSSSSTMYFTPHKVRFFCRDMFGKPIVGMSAQVYGIETTLGSIDWVLSLFGINLDVTPITTTLMTGTTGSDGSIVFIMMETEKYSIQYYSPENSINETRYYYPKQEEYIEIFWPETQPVSSTVIGETFINTTVNSTYTLLGVTYGDTLGTTTNFTFYIDNDTVIANSILHTQQRVYTYSSNSTTANTNITVNYTVPNIPGGGYFWGIIAVSNRYPYPHDPARYISFDANQWKINPMGAANGDPTAAMVYNAAAVGIIVIFALIFGRAAIKFGVIIVPLMSLFFWGIGWLQVAIMLISIAMTLGILAYFRYSEEDG